MRTLLTLIASLSLLLVTTEARPDDAEAVEWLSDQAVAYLGADTRLAPPALENGPWELVDGTIRIACRERIHLRVGGRAVVIEAGLATISFDGRLLDACVEEGELHIAAQRFADGECVAIEADSRPAASERSPDEMAGPLPPALRQHPAVQDDPWLSLDQALGASGAGGSGASAEGQAVESGGSAACLDTSSTGVDTGGPETPDIVQPEVDREGHIVHLNVTLEDF